MTVSAVTKRRYSNATYRTLRRVKTAGLYSGVAAVLVYMLFPYYWAIVSSTKTGQALYQFTLLPALDFSNYRQLFDNPVFMGALVNSGVVALVSTAVSLVIGILAAYALGRLHFPPGRIVLIAVLMISVFPQVVVLSGMFEVIGWLGLYNRPSALIVSYLILTLPFTTWILTSFIRDLPNELEEAALIDGCSRLRILTHVLLPLMGPAIASTGLLSFILAWNEFLFALTFILTDENRTVPVAIGLLTGSSRYEYPFGQIMAASVTVTLPLLVLVLIFQRKIVAGLTSGAVKG
ncbi:carbohydrate ABC transporter permease (plasmid) [Sinorhizobium meliloti WSM1022]|jgi:trehalose/maltose transport system permease protein|uniref:carbohydrate ABC transporter permease n=1 Tax=Rhizobium meliloti TaxID=382 RepID=UPI000416CF52|nr:carbohydrate ABC transporter permease [Sinorhizobium meliloti]AIM02864.1 sugar ABC transporter permease [Sinorhizobium meliloti]ASJ63544.1 sugar ABC transporter permease [Sinorhizobium meliloti]ASQ07988.1 carbohydrate ABC transporter permease [Sinorhizobium meliloti]MCK3786732.1 carbohydrate ABC transporter permease [Sinorhizobium meliloti]MCK3793016.1 carbohydrate ABC transporter permease [Sinorhizobium meliloti]